MSGTAYWKRLFSIRYFHAIPLPASSSKPAVILTSGTTGRSCNPQPLEILLWHRNFQPPRFNLIVRYKRFSLSTDQSCFWTGLRSLASSLSGGQVSLQNLLKNWVTTWTELNPLSCSVCHAVYRLLLDRIMKTSTQSSSRMLYKFPLSEKL